MLVLSLTLVLGGGVAVLVIFRLAELGADRIVERRLTREEQARAAGHDVRRRAAEVNDAWIRELTAVTRNR